MKRRHLLIICICIIGCQNVKKPHEVVHDAITTIHVNPDKRNSKEDFFKLVEDVRLLPLETKDQNSVSGVSRIWLSEGEIFLLTSNFVFQKYDKQGSFLLKKEKEGKGKGELITLRDFCPGEEGSFYILSYKRYFHYNRAGVFIGDYDVLTPHSNFNPMQFHLVGKDYELYSSSALFPQIPPEIEQYSFSLIDKVNNRHSLALRRYTANISDNCFNQSNSGFLINPVIGCDTIYTFDGNTIVPLFYIDFGEHKVVVNELPADYSSTEAVFSYARNNKKCIRIFGVMMDENWLMFSFFYHQSYYTALIHLKNERAMVFELNTENINHFMFRTGALAVFENEFVFSFPAHVLVEMRDSNSLDFRFLSPRRHQELMAQLKDVKETDNPVLMFVKLKAE